MTIRKDVYERWFGFTEKSSRIIEMPVDELYELARIEAPLRTDDDFPSKAVLFDPESFYKVPKLDKLYLNWDISKCDPIEICKEDDFRMINNGFHRIIVAHELKLQTLKVNLREGEFILQNHVRVAELPKLLGMLRTFFSTDSISAMEKILSDPKIDQEKIKHIFIGYGGLG